MQVEKACANKYGLIWLLVFYPERLQKIWCFSIDSEMLGTRRRRKVLAHVPQSGSPCQQSSISEEAQGICSRESPIRHDDLNLDPEKNMGDKELSTKSLGMFGEFSLDSAALGLNVSRIRIEFYGLSLQLKSSSKYVLRSASGVLIQSQLTAIMGPSGSGEYHIKSVTLGLLVKIYIA